MRDPFSNPFPTIDTDRREIWDMLVTRDIGAFLAADWSQVADDFIETGFVGINGNRADNPDRWTLAFPDLASYRDEWLRQAQDFAKESFAEDPRTAIFTTTNLTEIEILGDTALVRKKFDGSILKADGTRDIMQWQTLYTCRRHDGRWKIAGFTGYLPNPMGTA
ncbi:hypothetical protein QO002_003199 [Pararhizobium capsulatum DSM 1112]|uniref:SnoaL-like domain-containing protein n=1 Tax=Pararhizobium capsulatum DSM 1112 TaxID=1121113 RepID=A0ABU0BS26_9HYPH|nr:hypothetical protein [Pararhizobium capsulatum]MDQ0321061.1 hypothetical protein [Pararhizobium capsulatum DSM 1112]